MVPENKNYSVLQITLNFIVASLLSGAILAGTYFVTAPFAERNRQQLKTQTMQELIPAAKTFRSIPGQADWYQALDARGKPAGFILPAETRGYGGTIKILVAVDSKKRIIDYKILSHNETPGLGDRTALLPFRKQFFGKNKNSLFIDAITGATISSKAVTKGIKESLERLSAL